MTEPLVLCLADIEPTKVDWLWRGWLPYGKVSIIEGEPEEAKSLMTLTITAIVTNGGMWPGGDVADDGNVLLVGVEDDNEDTVVPRLIAAKADRKRVFNIVQEKDRNGQPLPFVIPEDTERLRKVVEQHDIKVVFIDPITAFLSTKQVKAGDDPSTRQALMPLVTIARDTGCAIVLVRHLNKAKGMSAKHRGSGTIAYTGITRSVIVAAALKEPELNGPTHAIAIVKANLAKKLSPMGYSVHSDTENPDIPVIKWHGELAHLTADALVSADGAKVGDARKAAPVAEGATEMLRDLLADGPMEQAEIMNIMKKNGAGSEKTIRKAAERLKVVKRKVYGDNGKIKHWTWELPPRKLKLIVAEGDSEV